MTNCLHPKQMKADAKAGLATENDEAVLSDFDGIFSEPSQASHR